MKPTTSGPHWNTRDERRWPGYLFGGRVRTSTVVLIVVFALAWWAYDVYRPTPRPVEAPQVVPPGFIPDPNYTWVPRTRLRQPTITVTPTTTETTPPPTPTSELESPPPPFPFPFPLPPFSPPAATPQPPPVSPGVAEPPAAPATPSAAPATRPPP